MGLVQRRPAWYQPRTFSLAQIKGRIEGTQNTILLYDEGQGEVQVQLTCLNRRMASSIEACHPPPDSNDCASSGWLSPAESRDRSEARDWFPCGLGVESAEIDESEEPVTDGLDGDPSTLVSSRLASSRLAAADVLIGVLLNCRLRAPGEPVGESSASMRIVSLVRGTGAKAASGSSGSLDSSESLKRIRESYTRGG